MEILLCLNHSFSCYEFGIENPVIKTPITSQFKQINSIFIFSTKILKNRSANQKGVIDCSTVKELFYHIFFENVTASETKIMNDHQAQINSLGNLKYLLDQIKVN